MKEKKSALTEGLENIINKRGLNNIPTENIKRSLEMAAKGRIDEKKEEEARSRNRVNTLKK
jgi:hypothetical protein